MRKAVFITRMTNADKVRVWPVQGGIVKKYGCVYYTNADNYFEPSKLTSQAVCRNRFCDYPESGAAYLVEPKPYGWLWTRIDHNMQTMTVLLNYDTKSILWV